MKGKPAVEDPARLTDAEWRARLTPEQYQICRNKGTEASGSGKYLHHKAEGSYSCVACGQKIFDSKTKYDSHCGWPSFWDALPGTVRIEPDLEGLCTRCGSHLGHVFDDGPPPTGKRY